MPVHSASLKRQIDNRAVKLSCKRESCSTAFRSSELKVLPTGTTEDWRAGFLSRAAAAGAAPVQSWAAPSEWPRAKQNSATEFGSHFALR